MVPFLRALEDRQATELVRTYPGPEARCDNPWESPISLGCWGPPIVEARANEVTQFNFRSVRKAPHCLLHAVAREASLGGQSCAESNSQNSLIKAARKEGLAQERLCFLFIPQIGASTLSQTLCWIREGTEVKETYLDSQAK